MLIFSVYKKSNSQMKSFFYQSFTSHLFLIFLLFQNFKCTFIKIRPLLLNDSKRAECQYTDQIDKKRTEIEQRIIKNHGQFTRTLLLNTNIGSPDKFLTVYRMRQMGENEFVLVFHFIDRYDYDIFKNEMAIKLDKGTVLNQKITQDPATVIISEISNQFFYFSLCREDFLMMSNSKRLSCSIELVEFEIPFDCREQWRELAEP